MPSRAAILKLATTLLESEIDLADDLAKKALDKAIADKNTVRVLELSEVVKLIAAHKAGK